MEQDIKIETKDFNFKFRVAGVIIKENKLLVVDMNDSGFYCLPGGYVELGEKTEEAIQRELREETGKEVKVKKYLGVIENYFINKYGKKIHEISFYYLLDFVDSNIPTEDFMRKEEDKGYHIKLNFYWIDLDSINQYPIKPEILVPYLHEKKLELGHLIYNALD